MPRPFLSDPQMCLVCAANTFCFTCDLEIGKTLHKSILEIVSQLTNVGTYWVPPWPPKLPIFSKFYLVRTVYSNIYCWYFKNFYCWQLWKKVRQNWSFVKLQKLQLKSVRKFRFLFTTIDHSIVVFWHFLQRKFVKVRITTLNSIFFENLVGFWRNRCNLWRFSYIFSKTFCY